MKAENNDTINRVSEGREKLKARNHKLELSFDAKEKSSVIIDRIKRPKGFGDQDERVRIKR